MIWSKSKTLLLTALLASEAFAAPRSAIITLSLPSGARHLGMGEAGMAVAEDAFATSWNPAALALSPLADEWGVSLPVGQYGVYTSMTGKAKQGFLSQSQAWVGRGSTLYRFESGQWKKEIEVPLEGRSLRAVVAQFLGRNNDLDSVVRVVRDYNGLDSNASVELVGKLRLPFDLVIKDPITTLSEDPSSGYLWVGTAKGLWRYNGLGWKNYQLELGDKPVRALAHQGATLWVATEQGLFRYQNQNWIQTGQLFGKSIQGPTDSLAADSTAKPDTLSTGSQNFTALAVSPDNSEVWTAIEGVGIARWKQDNGKDKWKLYTTAVDSLVEGPVQRLVVDAKKHVWAAHKAGISHFTTNKWARIEFQDTDVTDLALAGDQALWIGTQKGLWKFKPAYLRPGGEAERPKQGDAKEIEGEWEHYHRGTGMKNHDVQGVLALGDEIYVSTRAGVERLGKAKRQAAIFQENLLPALNIPDLYHVNAALTFPFQDWGTVGGFVNFVSFGETSYEPAGGNSTASPIKYNSKEMVAALSYGLKMTQNQALGANFKFVYSDLISGVPGQRDAKTSSYAFDISYLAKNVLPGWHLTAGLFNMGPEVYYVDKEKVDPIPLAWKFGTAYEYKTPVHRVLVVADYNRETLSESAPGSPDPAYIAAFKGWGDGGLNAIGRAVFSLGGEYTWDNMIALRSGYMFDRPGQREEISVGGSYLLSDLMQLDVGVIAVDLTGTGVRQGQFRMDAILRY